MEVECIRATTRSQIVPLLFARITSLGKLSAGFSVKEQPLLNAFAQTNSTTEH